MLFDVRVDPGPTHATSGKDGIDKTDHQICYPEASRA
jgi:hypothetical protein